jgi:hypothetical protein
MSTDGIPTPRTNAQKWLEGDYWVVNSRFSELLETELHCATRKLEQIRELVEEHNDITPTNKLRKILNS